MLWIMSNVPGWPDAFRGSGAVRAGLVTRAGLLGPRFVRLFPDIYVPAGNGPPDLAQRSRAAYRLVEGRGVLSGYSAAEVLGALCAPRETPAAVTVPGGGQRVHAGLVVHRDRLAPGEIGQVGDVRVTTPLRTAYDLARWADDVVAAVVAVDALANRGRYNPDLLLHFANRYRGARGNDRLAMILALADARSGSPMETRLRLVLVLGGLPKPAVQHVVADQRTRTAVWLDLAYPAERIGIEYEGAQHAAPDHVLRDVGRYTRLVDNGWRIYRYTRHDVFGAPARIVDEIARALGPRAR